MSVGPCATCERLIPHRMMAQARAGMSAVAREQAMSVAENLSSTAPNIPTGEELVARARALAPKLRERAVACRARPQHSTRVGRGIHRRRSHPYHAAQALGRLRARPRGRVRHRDRARQVDLRLVGLVPELSERSRLHPVAFLRGGAARRLESQTKPPASPLRRRRPARPRSRPAAIASTAAGPGAAGCGTRNGS